MQYAILIYGEEGQWEKMTPEEQQAGMGAYYAYTNALKEAGVLTGGEALQPTTTGTTLRVRNGQRSVQDGPFAEAKEQLGGFYLIDVPNLDTALDWAARCPGASYGAVEVRPIMTFD